MFNDDAYLQALKHKLNSNVPTVNVYSNTSFGTFCTRIDRVSLATYTVLLDASFHVTSMPKRKALHHEQHELFVVEGNRKFLSNFKNVK